MSNRNGNLNGNGHVPVAQLREQHEAAKLRAEIAAYQQDAQLLENYGDWWGGYGSPNSFARWPSPFNLPAGWQAWGLGIAGRIDASKDGAQRPFIWHDIDMDRARNIARWLATEDRLAIGCIEGIADYTVRTGFKYDSKPGKRFTKDAIAKELANQVQEVVDEFLGLNVLGETPEQQQSWADWEREAVIRDVVDGEVFMRTFPQPDGTTWARPIFPEQIRKPMGSGPEWDFGCKHYPGDIIRITDYAVTYDATQPDQWDEVSAEEISHHKSNVWSCHKRGLSDFFCAAQTFDEVTKLVRNMDISASAQAAIAWIEQHPSASQEALSALVAKTKAQNVPNMPNPLTGRDDQYQQVQPGQRLLVGGNRTYASAPLAANTTQHINIASMAIRTLAARWRMSPTMFASDSSEVNYAVALTAGSPFVTRVECRQPKYGRFFLRVIWSAIRNAAKHGRFLIAGHRFTWQEVSRLVDVVFTPPQVAISDKGAENAANVQYVSASVMSLQTARARIGLDNETEVANLREEPPTRVVGRATDVDQSGNPQRPDGGEGLGFGEEFYSRTDDPLLRQLTELRYKYGPELTEEIAAAAQVLIEGVKPNKSGPGCHDESGKPAKCPEISTAERPKTKEGLYHKSDELHAASQQLDLEKRLRGETHPKDRGKFDALMGKLKEMHSGNVTAPQSAVLAPEHVASAFSAAQSAVGPHNLAKLADYRDALAASGIPDRAQQDAAILELWKQGRIGLSGPEGRSAISDREKAGWLKIGEHVMGHVYLRQREGADALDGNLLESVPNKTGPGCHDPKTGHPAACESGNNLAVTSTGDVAMDKAQALLAKSKAEREERTASEAVKEKARAERKQARKDVVEAAASSFGGKQSVEGNEIHIEDQGRQIHLEFKPRERSVFVDFTQAESSTGGSEKQHGKTGWDVTGKELQTGTIELLHKFKDFVSKAHEKGIGIEYETTEDRRKRIYAKILTAAGFEQVADGEWKPSAMRTQESVQSVDEFAIWLLESIPNKKGPGCHDPQTGHPAACETDGAGGGAKQPPKSSSFEKAPAVKGRMIEATRIGTGKDAKIVLKNGQEAPDHIKASMVPPDWTGVQVSLDPKAELLVTAADNKGRPKSVYADSFHTRNAAVKLARVDEMIQQSAKIDSEIQAARQDPAKRESADCAWLMSVQATRPGSDSDTGGDVKAYGATTLEGRHVTQDENGVVRLSFIGKEGVRHDHVIRDPKLAKMLLDRSNKAGASGRLFDTNAAKVNKFIGELDGGHFSAKDFRTRRANQLAVAAMKEFKTPPKDEKEYKKFVKIIAEKVSDVLGNRPAQALESYINPAVFSSWKVAQ